MIVSISKGNLIPKIVLNYTKLCYNRDILWDVWFASFHPGEFYFFLRNGEKFVKNAKLADAQTVAFLPLAHKFVS